MAMHSHGDLGHPYFGACRKEDIEDLCDEVMIKYRNGSVVNPHAFLCAAMRAMGLRRFESRYYESRLDREAGLARLERLDREATLAYELRRRTPGVPTAPKNVPPECRLDAEIAASFSPPPEVELALRNGARLSDLMGIESTVIPVSPHPSVPPIHTIGTPHFAGASGVLEGGLRSALPKAAPPLFKAAPLPQAATPVAPIEPESEPLARPWREPVGMSAPPVDTPMDLATQLEMSAAEFNLGELAVAAARAARLQQLATTPKTKSIPPHVSSSPGSLLNTMAPPAKFCPPFKAAPPPSSSAPLAPLVKGPPPAVLAAMEAGIDLWLAPDLAPPSASPPSTTPAVVVGVPVTLDAAWQTHGEEGFMAAIEDEDLEDDVAGSLRWEAARSALIAVDLHHSTCACHDCCQIRWEAANILNAGDMAHALLGDAVGTTAPVVEFIVGSAEEREATDRLLQGVPMVPVVVHEASDAVIEAPAAAAAPDTSSSSSLPGTVDLPEFADSLHDMD